MANQHAPLDPALALQVYELRRQGVSVGDVMRDHNLSSRDAVRRLRLRGEALAAQGGASAHVAPVVRGQAPTRPTPAATWEEVERRTERDVARHETERLVEVAIPDTRPIAVSIASDQHIRLSGPVQMRRMREDAELVSDTDGLYMMLGGDGVDNHIKHREAMANGGSKPADEWRLYEHYLGMFGPGKILAMISGNHDDWTRDFTGVDQVAQLAARNRVHYAPDEAMVHLDLSGILYRIKLRHQFRFNSSLNLIHTVKRLWEMGNDPFDIGVVCHHHEPAIEPFTKHGRTVWGARPGSYQLTSSHSRRYGYALNQPACPTFVLFPDTHEILGFLDVRQAAGFLRWARATWPHGYRSGLCDEEAA